MALAASACVTTEQELKLAVAAVVDVDAVVDGLDAAVVDTDALVVCVVLDDVEDGELHAASGMAEKITTTTPTKPECSFGCSFIKLVRDL